MNVLVRVLVVKHYIGSTLHCPILIAGDISIIMKKSDGKQKLIIRLNYPTILPF